jgi:uncharacterized membrane protein YheB (UPF0754 family)
VNEDLVRALLTIGFGAVAGGVTNALAVWMLFHPYEPPRFLGREWRIFQGAIPKNKGRLAIAMGRTVGTKLLPPEDLARTLTEPAFRDTFDDRLREFIRMLFEERRGSVSSLLTPAAQIEVRAMLQQGADTALLRLDTYLAGESFRRAVERWLQMLKDELRDRPVGEDLTEERQHALTTAAERWLGEMLESPGIDAALRDYIDRTALRVLQPDRTFQELLPTGLIAGVERAIASYLPIAIEKLGGMLDDPRARARVEQILHELLDRFLGDLKFHQRLVAALLIPSDVIDRVLRAVEKEGAAKISELLHDPAVRDAMAQGVNSAIVDFLAKPVTSVLGEPGDESVESAKGTIVEWVLTLLRDPQTRAFAVEKLHALLDSAQGRTWGDVLRHLPDEKIVDAIVTGARSDRARELYADAARGGIDWALERPIGRLADKFGEDAAPRLERALAPPLWTWIQEQVPRVVQRLDIAKRVEAKIIEFPTAQVEELIRGVTERELVLIVQLGYVLGGLIGLMSAGISLLF